MSLESQISNYTGSLPAGLTSVELEKLLINGISDIVKKVKTFVPDDLWLFTKTENVPSDGLTVETSSVQEVHLITSTGLWRGCKQIPISKRYQAADSDSINYATAEYPVFYVNNKKVHVLPTPGVSDSEEVTSYSQYLGTNDNTLLTTSNALSGVSAGDYISITRTDEQSASATDKYYIGVHKVIYVNSNQIAIERDYDSNVSHTATYATTAYSVASHVYIPTVNDFNANTDDTISNFPNSYIGILVIYGALQVLHRRISDMYNNLPVLNLPAIPVAPILEESSLTISDFNVPSGFILPVSPDNEDVDYSGVSSSVPSIDVVFAPPITFFEFPLSAIDISDLTLDNIPAPPIAPDYANLNTIGIDYGTTVRNKEPVYNKPTMVLPALPALSALNLPAVPVPPEGPDFSDAQTNIANSNIPAYIPAVSGALDFDQVSTFIETEEDSELAAAQIQKIQTKLQEVQSKSQEQLNLFNADMNEYKSKIDEALANSSKQLDSDNQEYQAKLSRYQAEVQTYQIETNNILGKWGKEEIENKFSKWQIDCTNSLQQYQQEVQNELNSFNQNVSIYQAEIQKAQGDASNIVSTKSSEYQSVLAKYQAELESYKSKTNNEITKWSSDTVQKAVTEFTTKRNDEMQKWNSENALALQKHSQEVQQEKNKIDSEIAIWQGEIQKELQTYQAEDGSDLAKYQAKVQAEMGRFDSDLKKSVEEYNSDINKMNADIARITEKNQSRIAKSNYDLQMYTAESQSITQKFQGELTKDEKEYNFYINQYQTLKAEYDSTFLIPNDKEQ